MYAELVENVNAIQTIDTSSIAYKANHNTKIKITKIKYLMIINILLLLNLII